MGIKDAHRMGCACQGTNPCGTAEIAGRRVTVVGAGRSGRAAAALAARAGAEVKLAEARPGAVSEAQRRDLTARGIELSVGPHTSDDFAGAHVVVLSPGIAQQSIAPFLPDRRKVQVISELELALAWVREPIIAVTGTNGKTTTVSLIDHILRCFGVQCFTGGNIGTPLSEYVLSGPDRDVVVLEVSSFQLQHTRSLQPRVAVWLNFSVNHLDHHQDLEEYRRAKRSLFARQESGDTALIHASLWPELQGGELTQAEIVLFDREHGFELPQLPGAHNSTNMEAAYLACAPWGISVQAARQVMESYEPHPHRLQRVGEKNGVLFVNDSKATTVHAMKAALCSLDRPIHLLAGGKYKGGDLQEVVDLLRQRVRRVTLFGESREIFTQAWGSAVPMDWRPTLEEAVNHAAGLAQSGEVVLLSPGTASFDLFPGYAARGEAFVQAVKDLPGEGL